MSEGEAVKFQELVHCSRSEYDEVAPCETEDGEGLVLLHDRLVKAAAEIGDQSCHDLVKEQENLCP